MPPPPPPTTTPKKTLEEDDPFTKEVCGLAGFLRKFYYTELCDILLDADASKLHFPLVIECVPLPISYPFLFFLLLQTLTPIHLADSRSSWSSTLSLPKISTPIPAITSTSSTSLLDAPR
jgi:hypothetical protein